jgi:predicted RNA-binding Zn-ribbon protein involved in translation (DUF1610 family)
MSSCKCKNYEDPDSRAALNKRAAETKRISAALQFIAEHPGKEHRLYECPVCGQMWQRSMAWMLGNKAYLFKVPPIENEQWLQQPFVQPDELLSRIAHVQLYLDRAFFEEQAALCKSPDCGEHSIKFSVFCAFHHMQSIGIKAEFNDEYRWFGPYTRSNYEFNIGQLKKLPNYKKLE